MAQTNEVIEITAEEFGKYLAVQRSGRTNMFDIEVVRALSGLPKEKIIYIISNYTELWDKYNK